MNEVLAGAAFHDWGYSGNRQDLEALNNHRSDVASIFGIGVGLLFSSGDVSKLGQSQMIATSATENNRWLHPEEVVAIQKYVEDNDISCSDVGLGSCTEQDIINVLGQQALRNVDGVWNAEFEVNEDAQEVLSQIEKQYGSQFVDEFGKQGKDDYFNTAITFSQYVHGNDQMYYAGGSIDGRSGCQTGFDFCRDTVGMDEFYDGVFENWTPTNNWTVAGDRGSSVFAYAEKYTLNVDKNGNAIQGGWHNVAF